MQNSKHFALIFCKKAVNYLFKVNKKKTTEKVKYIQS